jgi:hypothetical protein
VHARSARIRKGVRGKPKFCAFDQETGKSQRDCSSLAGLSASKKGRCPLRPPLWGSFDRCAVSVAGSADGQGLHPAPAKPRAWVPGRSTTMQTAKKRSLTRARALREERSGAAARSRLRPSYAVCGKGSGDDRDGIAKGLAPWPHDKLKVCVSAPLSGPCRVSGTCSNDQARRS